MVLTLKKVFACFCHRFFGPSSAFSRKRSSRIYVYLFLYVCCPAPSCCAPGCMYLPLCYVTDYNILSYFKSGRSLKFCMPHVVCMHQLFFKLTLGCNFIANTVLLIAPLTAKIFCIMLLFF